MILVTDFRYLFTTSTKLGIQRKSFTYEGNQNGLFNTCAKAVHSKEGGRALDISFFVYSLTGVPKYDQQFNLVGQISVA